MTQRPSPYATSLEVFDPLELLFMLGRSGRSGLLRFTHDRGELRLALRQGRVTEVSLGTLQGPAALAVVVDDPRGLFNFEDGPATRGALDLNVEALALAALRELPAPAPLFDGPGKLSEQVTAADLALTSAEGAALDRLLSSPSVAQAGRDPEVRALAGRLGRLGLLVPRKARVARLTLAADLSRARTAQVDEVILARWREDTGAPVQTIAVKTEAGRVVNFAVRPQSGLSNSLLLPREWLVQFGLRSGESVLVRPA